LGVVEINPLKYKRQEKALGILCPVGQHFSRVIHSLSLKTKRFDKLQRNDQLLVNFFQV